MIEAAMLVIAASASPPCSGGVYDQFDFWVGDWTIEQRVHQADGSVETYPATTSVRRSADGCTLTENWRGTTRLFWYGMDEPEEIWGYSVRRVDPKTGQWAISWIDAKNAMTFGEPFVGGFADGIGTFYQEAEQRRGRIRFRPQADGSVLWDLATLPPGRPDWHMLWEMRMRPAGQAGLSE